MKKISTLSLALATAATAFAVNPNVKVADSNLGSEVAPVEMQRPAISTLSQTNAVAVSGLVREVVAASAEGATGEDVNLQYVYPAPTMFNYICFTEDGELATLKNPDYGVIPAFTDVTFRNQSYRVTGSGAERANTGLSYSWTLGQATETAEYNYTFETTPAFYHGYGYSAPTLELGNKSFQLGHEGQTTTGQTMFFPDFFISGGFPYATQDRIEQLTNTYPTATDFHAVYKLINNSVEGATGFRSEDVFNLGHGDADEAWGALLNENCTNAKLAALGQRFPDPGQAWTISSVDMLFMAIMDQGTTFKVSFYGLKENGWPDYDNVINTYTYTAEKKIGTLREPELIELSIPFTTIDDMGDEIAYKVVEGGMFMVIDGVLGNAGVRRLCPLVSAYPVINDRNVLNNYMVGNLYGFVDCLENGEETTYMARNGYVFGDDPVTSPVTFNISLNAEYPYMQPDQVITQASTEGWEWIEGTPNEFEVNVRNSDDQTLYRVLCPGTNDDLVISCVGMEDIPEWLSVSVENANDFFTNLEAEARAYIIQFALADGAQPSGCEIEVEYKGIKNIYKVNPDLSGIEGVVESGAETVSSEYYDLQGRKLYGEPANGLFIRKDIKADGSVKAVKIAK